jgi:hypothetical protein
MRTYFIVVCKVSVQIIQEMAPIILSGEKLLPRPVIMALITYKGEVPRSPNTIPRVITIPARDNLLLKEFLESIIRIIQ